ncbi:hypothetical protein [Caulobacter zeae]|uniref:hypothetical protein n=1 Tax=Caulobacter zeae TaxID=2055137 RepID=UPI00105630D8|nr:hypothetical protein [Caulobacter zeae]
MGGPSPNRVSPPASPLAALTVTEMHAKRWTVRSRCRRCGLTLKVHLPSVIRVLGPDAVLWGRTFRCQRVDDGFACAGDTGYTAQTIRHGSWVGLRAATAREIQLAHANRATAAYDAYRGREPTGFDGKPSGST